MQQRRRRLQLLHGLGTDGDATAAADRAGSDRRDGEAAPGLEDALVVGQHVAGHRADQRGALASHAGQLLLDGRQLLAHDGLFALALFVTGLQPALGFADLAGEAFLTLHERQDLLLGLGLLALDGLDLGEDGRVFHVRLHLVESRFRLRPLDRDVVEILFTRAQVLPGAVEPRLHGFHRLLGLGHRGVDGLDLLGEPDGFGFEGGDLRVEFLEMNEGLELTHGRSTPMVCSQPSERPKRRRSTFASRGVSVFRTLFVCSRSERPMIDSTGDTTCLSSMKSPRWLSSSSPIGVSREIGSWAILRTLRTLSTGTSIFSAISSGVGSRPSSWTSWREVRISLLIVSIMWTGMRIVRAWSAIARVMACRIHHVA